MKIKTKSALMELAGEGITLDEMLEEAALRLIEYAKEENITVFCKVKGEYCKVKSDTRLYGYESTEMEARP